MFAATSRSCVAFKCKTISSPDGKRNLECPGLPPLDRACAQAQTIDWRHTAISSSLEKAESRASKTAALSNGFQDVKVKKGGAYADRDYLQEENWTTCTQSAEFETLHTVQE